MAWLRTCSLACLCAGASAVFWEVTEGIMCEVDAEDCIMNVEAPGGSYFGSDSCRFRVVVGDWDCHAISVDYFEVDTPDSLRVNGVGYTGTSSPSGIVPSSDIQWTVRSTLPTGMGFRLCPEDVCATEAAAAKGSGTSMLMISILCVVGVVICGLAGACYFLSRKPRPAVVLPAQAPAPKPPVVMGAAVSATPIRDAGIASGSAHDAMRETPAREVVGHFVKQAVRTDKVPQQDRAAPGYWTNVVLASDFCGLVDVSRHETSAIERMLHDTFKEVSTSDRKGAAMPKSLKIVKVKRNENLQLWQKYTAGRYGIQNTHGHRCVSLDGVYGGKVLTLADLPPEVKRELNPRVNEHFLWHGTNPVAADAICKTGFDLARAGSNAGSMYGPGTYFAECSSKSDEYANSSNVGIYDGMCCLLLCRVVLGEVQMLTNAGEAVHGIVKTSMESGMYDSVLGNRQAAVGTYREFVVYQEDQMYPEYVVIYERQF
mmetsp:Transcript_6872/g.17564  ORF Transcript_6872/g.17564 Transcript_6872/m.17564 type:complete len:486 (-) Transcript_6872:378-1835(-)